MSANYFDLARDEAMAYRERVKARIAKIRPPLPDPDRAPSVLVKLTIDVNGQRVPCGDAGFARCVADVFEQGVLTITHVSGREVREYPFGQWLEAQCFDTDGHLMHTLLPEVER